MLANVNKTAETRMRRAIEVLAQEFSRMRTGRAHPSILEPIQVDYYGNATPLRQVANITIEDARTLSVIPWEKSLVPTIEKAIMSADLGLNPVTAGDVIRIPLPPLTEERRKEMVKLVKHETEQTRVSIRNIRRDANAEIKQLLKDKQITEDEGKKGEDNIQRLTDRYIAEADKVFAAKEKDLMAI